MGERRGAESVGMREEGERTRGECGNERGEIEWVERRERERKSGCERGEIEWGEEGERERDR